MGADRARVSYDRSRHWRGVVNQQGRVTLEADWNEAATISSEEDREQLLDVIGPSGAPGEGYEVSVAAEPDEVPELTVREGTLYVGGEQMVLEEELEYGAQPDWIDTAQDPLWVEPTNPEGDVDEAVYLLLREQEVGAVEDPALLDVALGGPDTSGRLRILQRVVRHRTGEASCAGALQELERYWQTTLGLKFDAATMRLESTAELLVSFDPPPEAAPPCQPVAQGGYLEADNQLIRVQVASVDEATGRPTLVWGFDNAYFLHRIKPHPIVDKSAGTTTVTLENLPVDSFHQPVEGQAVEVLRAAAHLSETEARTEQAEAEKEDGYVAAQCGIVTTVSRSYDADTHELTIATALEEWMTASPLLFLRVWQETIVYTAGPAPLGKTGLTVTLTNDGDYHVGDYWVFAVRPGTPNSVSPVYPQRILETPQPPDGPRMWACPLAVLAWESGTPKVTDCRERFENLVELTERVGGCCTIDVSPADVAGGAGLQALIDRYRHKGPTTICLDTGTYALPGPLVLDSGHADLTIQGCQGEVVLQASGVKSELAPERFLLGLILLEEASNLTLRGLQLRIPSVRFLFEKEAIEGTPAELHKLLVAFGDDLALSFGVFASGGSNLSIEQCGFSFAASRTNIFGAAMLGTGTIEGLELLDCAFTAPEPTTVPFGQPHDDEGAGLTQVRFGYLQVPTRSLPSRLALFKAKPLEQARRPTAIETQARRRAAARQRPGASTQQRVGVKSAAEPAAPATAQEQEAQLVQPSLAEATVERNLFDGLTVPMLVLGRLGTTRLQDNTVRACYGGFWLITFEEVERTMVMVDRMQTTDDAMVSALRTLDLTALSDPVLLLAAVLGRILPLTPPSSEPAGSVGRIARPSDELLAGAMTQFARLYELSPQDSDASAAATGPSAPATDPSTAAGPEPVEEPDEQTAPRAAGETQLPPAIIEAFKNPEYVAGADLVPEVDPGTALIARLSIGQNQVDAVIEDADSGAGLLVVILDTTMASTLIAAANRVRSRVADGATVGLYALHACTLTGNIISNEVVHSETSASLVVRAEADEKRPAYAVTGNALIGLLPGGYPPAPAVDWATLNTVVPYIQRP
jgi:hypothetical protein